METRLANGVINRWTHLLTLVKGNRIHLLSLCKSSTSSDPLRGQTAMPRVSAQQIDSDDEAFFAAESSVIDQEHDERVWSDQGYGKEPYL